MFHNTIARQAKSISDNGRQTTESMASSFRPQWQWDAARRSYFCFHQGSLIYYDGTMVQSAIPVVEYDNHPTMAAHASPSPFHGFIDPRHHMGHRVTSAGSGEPATDFTLQSQQQVATQYAKR